MRRTSLARAIDASPLPLRVKEALQISCSRPGSTIRPALSSRPGETLLAVSSLLLSAGRALGLPPAEALFCGGFSPADAAPERLGAALAELQAAAFLASEGAGGLRLLPRCEALSADLAGAWRGGDCVFEVRSLRRGKNWPLEYLFSGGRGPAPPEALTYLEPKYDKKIRQLKCSRRSCGCPRGGVIFSVDLFAEADSRLMKELARGLHSAKGSSPATAVLLLAGRGGAVFPA